MARSRNRFKGRDVDGVLVLDKPAGLSSNEALQKAKRIFGAAKAGHTGSLDPLATGVLPLCFGEGTKLSQFLLNSDKRYFVRIKLGVRTDSGDCDGKVICERDARGVTREALQAVIGRYQGELQQIPSMFSAIKHEGQPLYKLARQGIEVERKPRSIKVYQHDLVSFEDGEYEADIRCSKGTYVRSLADDIGEELDCGAHVIALRRLQVGPFMESELITLDQLEDVRAADGLPGLDALLQPIWSAVRDWPLVQVEENSVYYLKQGQSVLVPHAPTQGWVRICSARDEAFIGVGEVLDDGRIAPRRLLAA